MKPSQEAFHVPMFIRFSPSVDTAQVMSGMVETSFSTVNNFELINHWIGVTLDNQPQSTFSQVI